MSLHLAAHAYLQTLETDLPDFLIRQKKAGIQDKVPIITDEVGHMLRMLCALQHPKHILELGSGIGYATHWMLLGCPNAQITSVDANQDRLNLAANHLEESGSQDQVKLVCSWVETFLEQREQTYDLIFLDSTKKDYPSLLNQCYKALNINGLLVADNIFYQSKLLLPKAQLSLKEQKNTALMDQFNRSSSSHPGLDTQFFALGDGLLIARKLT